jgi:hypothetical protein
VERAGIADIAGEGKKQPATGWGSASSTLMTGAGPHLETIWAVNGSCQTLGLDVG